MNTNCKFITDIVVIDVEKRFEPSKFYVYCLLVTWSNSNRYKIYRRYSQFHNFQCKLEYEFCKESSNCKSNDKILPVLPPKIFIGRSQTFSVAIERKYQINDYCKKLIKLPEDISRSNIVNDFFSFNQEDLTNVVQRESKFDLNKISLPIETRKYVCIHDFKAKSSSELSVSEDQIVDVHMKNLNGWWFVSHSYGQGYLPKLVIQALNYDDFIEDKNNFRVDKSSLFIVVNNYNARNEDELSIKKAEYIRVLEKRYNGWWTVKYEDKIGLAPAVCIRELYLNEKNKQLIYSINAIDSIPSLDSSIKIESIHSQDSVDKFEKKMHTIIRRKPTRPPAPIIKAQILNVDDLLETKL